MRIKIEFKGDLSEDERFGTYDTPRGVDDMSDVARAVNSKPFIELTWRKPVSPQVYKNDPVLIACDTIASISESDR